MRICYVCGKKPMVGNVRRLLRGHYNPTGRKIKRPNLQWMKLPSGGRAKVCTKCIKKPAHA